MSLHELEARALQIQDLYYRLNERERGRRWTNEETMLGFVGDVGDLAKLVMAQEGAREVRGGRAALAHELAAASGRCWCSRTPTASTWSPSSSRRCATSSEASRSGWTRQPGRDDGTQRGSEVGSRLSSRSS